MDKRLWGIGLALVLVLAMIIPIHAMALGAGMHIGRDGYWIPTIQQKPASTGSTNTSTQTTTTTSTSTTTSTYTTTSTSVSSYTYTILQDIEKFLTWLAWTPQGQCQAGLCMYKQLMSIGLVTSGGHGNSHTMSNAIYIPTEYAVFQYSDFGIQPTIVVTEVFHTYSITTVYTTVTRTIVETINTTTSIMKTISGNGGNSGNTGPTSSPPTGNTTSSNSSALLNVGDTVYYDAAKALDFLGASITKMLSDVLAEEALGLYGVANVINGAANNLGNNIIANGLNWIANELTGIAKALANLAGELTNASAQLVYQGESMNTSWNTNGNVNTGINPIIG